jgi:hypothetical protein
MREARLKFNTKYPLISYQCAFAGTLQKQLYIQMHESHHISLLRGTKTITRRAWEPRWINAHQRAMDNSTLVAVFGGQSHASTLGFIRYTSITQTTVGQPLTPVDLRKEGYCGWTDAMFRDRWYCKRGTRDPLPANTIIYILSFQFYPI